MCFTKSSKTSIPETVEEEDSVQIHEADASTTKNSKNNAETSAYKQNVKTSAFGLQDEAKTDKKTLLGE